MRRQLQQRKLPHHPRVGGLWNLIMGSVTFVYTISTISHPLVSTVMGLPRPPTMQPRHCLATTMLAKYRSATEFVVLVVRPVSGRRLIDHLLTVER